MMTDLWKETDGKGSEDVTQDSVFVEDVIFMKKEQKWWMRSSLSTHNNTSHLSFVTVL